MSTRCAVTVNVEREGRDTEQVHYYHHHDGYPTGVGLELFQFIMKQHDNISQYGWRHTAQALHRGYEIEDECAGDTHGDLEYFYEITIDKNEHITCKMYELESFGAKSWRDTKAKEIFKFGEYGLRHVTIKA